MKKSYIILVVILGILGFIFMREQAPYLEQDLTVLNEDNDGKIVSYEEINVLSWLKKLNEHKDINKYEEIKEKINNTYLYKVTYLSDGEEAEAFIMKPKEEGNYPVLFFNASSKIKDMEDKRAAFYWFSSFFSEDYIIVAPKYGGDYGGNQLEDFSAADSEQFLDLVKLTKSLPYIDKNKMAAIGIEKGGQLVYQAIKNNIGLNAAVVSNTPTELIELYNDSISARKKIFEDKLGGTPSEAKENYIAKSPYYWAEEIDIPLLILHSKEAKNVKSAQSRKLVDKFNEIGYKNYEAIINSNMTGKFRYNRYREWIREKTDIPLEMLGEK